MRGALTDEINWKHQTEDWKPIYFLVAHHDAQTVHAFLRMAPMCIVSSLHDGMNLVAKEYVAAQGGSDGGWCSPSSPARHASCPTR